MQSIKKIIMLVAGGLIILGFVIALLAFALAGFNWSSFNTSLPDEETSYSYDLASVSSLTVSELDADVIIVGTDEDKIKITCYENKKDAYTIQLQANGNLNINRSLYKHWYEYIGFNISNQKRTLTVAIPQKFTGEVEAATMSGNLDLTDFDGLAAVSTSTASGRITLKNVMAANHISASTLSGDLALDNLRAGKDLEIGTSSGEIQLTNGKIAGNLSISSLSSNIDLVDTSINGDSSIGNSSGNVNFNKLAANNLSITTLSGNVIGSILGDPANYTITADSLSGKIDIPHSENGKNTFDISTSSGNIDIEFTSAN
ncbi:DUF4097 family beta strand repeat-containing protein [Acetobacterium sp.]|uniref:DUF4097 family beta strand repeat-containing protein n=1 Tax=Acetobacterium sp. TaxID=1872094 RepID=UPI00271DD135|nr:DUF4097 family beta strand repeat-containing protein [Acetobacterium sp.]MDO9492516.1 DUF4097 family beta strand repeat-containing protein [Acetobacterium sp.]